MLYQRNPHLSRCASVAFVAAVLALSIPALQAQDTLVVEGDNVGIGVTTPARKLHVVGTDKANTRVHVQNTSGTSSAATLFAIQNLGPTFFSIRNDSGANQWTFGVANTGEFTISKGGSGVQEARFSSGGNLNIAGTLTQGSSRTLKRSFNLVDGREILAKVADLPISTWSYRSDKAETRHLGPISEDFYAAFGLGKTDQGIATVDLDGVALAAIQGLNQLISEKDAQIADLEQRLAVLESEVRGTAPGN